MSPNPAPPQAPQNIRNTVADFICPIDSIANSQQGYTRHEAEKIRAGRGDDHELMRLVMGCVGADGDDGVIQADREAAAAFLEHFQVHAWEKSVGNIRNGHGDLGYSVQSFARHRQQHAPPSPSGYERELDELRAKLRMVVSHATGGHSQDIDAGVNDICVRISANRNAIYQAGKDRSLEEAAKVARAVFDANPGDNDSSSGSRAAAAGIEAAILTLKDHAR